MGEGIIEPRSDFLYAEPSFFEGVARLLDFGNTLNEYNTSPSGEIADKIAIGMDWAVIGKDMNDAIKKMKVGSDVRDVVLIKDSPEIIFLATNSGIVKSSDKGESWKKIQLISPGKKANINAIAVNPAMTDEIFYVTNTTFNRSVDGGQNWTPLKLPTTRAGKMLIIDPQKPNIIYMGVYGNVKK